MSQMLKQLATKQHKEEKEGRKRAFVNSLNEQDSNKRQKISFDEENVVKPFVYHDSERMVIFYRLNLTQDVDLAVTGNKLIIAVYQCSFLTDVERQVTDLYRTNPQFVAKQREDDGTISITVDLPNNVRTDTLDRTNIDTKFGWLLEITFLKKKEIDPSKLIGKRFSHIECAPNTTEQLQHNLDPTSILGSISELQC